MEPLSSSLVSFSPAVVLRWEGPGRVTGFHPQLEVGGVLTPALLRKSSGAGF